MGDYLMREVIKLREHIAKLEFTLRYACDVYIVSDEFVGEQREIAVERAVDIIKARASEASDGI